LGRVRAPVALLQSKYICHLFAAKCRLVDSKEVVMSWEEMSAETKICPCGKGTITYCMEMDDWNRIRHHKKINCPKCKAQADEKIRLEIERDQNREMLLAKALRIAEERYLARWLGMYANKSKKAVWMLYTGGSGYPALGTFYKHVQDEGIEQYLRRNFSHDFQKALKQMKVKDGDIQELLAARERI
jgi:hypothetical protein